MNEANKQVYGQSITNVSDYWLNDKGLGGEYERKRVRKGWTQKRRHDEQGNFYPISKAKNNKIRMIADYNRRQDQKASREQAYKKNQKRIVKQQVKARIKNKLKKITKRR